ncbi:unnamed protein product [Owenia fusiformis]|uniref:CDK-activating kinase assembly factor MAT1 n=1 Tax=Owenia fusiformis TaxID=6347 RepID=A0A8J1TVI8_OWEFU|nr:unnamed protein product [Owenia fusiformis]
MEEQSCPRCGTNKYRNPNMKFLVNVCGHSICDNCVEVLFVRGSAACPACKIPLRRTNFRIQFFEDSSVEKEMDIRKKILRDYNKQEEDFPTLRAYNDYLEDIETTIFNLANGVDVEETKKKIEQYKKENKDTIRKNQSKLSRDEELIEALIEEERELQESHRNDMKQEETKEKTRKIQNKEALIDELMFSEAPANYILASHKAEVARQREDEEEEAPSLPKARTTMFSSGIRVGQQRGDTFPSTVPIEAALYIYSPLSIQYCGPDVPDTPAMLQNGYLNHMREASQADRGGGYEAKVGCSRAVQEALCGLFYTYQEPESQAQESSSSSSPSSSHMEMEIS